MITILYPPGNQHTKNGVFADLFLCYISGNLVATLHTVSPLL